MHQPKGYNCKHMYWQITDDLPNLPNFPAIQYTVRLTKPLVWYRSKIMLCMLASHLSMYSSMQVDWVTCSSFCKFECPYTVSLRVCMFEGLYVWRFVCLRVCMFEGLYVWGFICLKVCMFEGLYVWGLVCLRVCMFEGLYVWRFVCLKVCMFEGCNLLA